MTEKSIWQESALQIPLCKKLEFEILLDFTIPLRATPWKRAMGRTRYTPPDVKAWEHHIRTVIAEEMAIEGVDPQFFIDQEPVGLEVIIGMTRKSMNVGGDGDNYVKAVQDALRGFTWKDDRIRHLRPVLINPVPSEEDFTRIIIFNRR